jgi:hypothetical protein
MNLFTLYNLHELTLSRPWDTIYYTLSLRREVGKCAGIQYITPPLCVGK